MKSKNPAEIIKLLISNSKRGIEKWNYRSLELLFVRNLHIFLDVPVVYEKFIRSIIPSHLLSKPLGNTVRHIEVHKNKNLLLQPIDYKDQQSNTSLVYFSDGYCCVLNEMKLRELLLSDNKNIPYIMMITSFI